MSQLEQPPEPPQLPQLSQLSQLPQPEQPPQLSQLPEQPPQLSQLPLLEQPPQFSQLLTLTTSSRAGRRPLYIIGHMANDLPTMDSFIKAGANAVECDVAFTKEGVAESMYHGIPCDALRVCHKKEKFETFLSAASTRKILLLMLDLKCSDLSVSTMKFAGEDIAQKLIVHFWKKSMFHVIPVVISIPWSALTIDEAFIKGFTEVIRKNPAYEDRIAYNLSETTDTTRSVQLLEASGITNIWLCDGATNWLQLSRGLDRIREMVVLRDFGESNVKKVYAWTVDYKEKMRAMMDIGIDGIVTNQPGRAQDVLRGRPDYRLADKQDAFCDRFVPTRMSAKKN